MIMIPWGKRTSPRFLLSMYWTKAGRKPTTFISYLQQAESPYSPEAWHKQCHEVIMAGMKLAGIPWDVEAQRREGKNKRLRIFSTPLEVHGENKWVRWLLYVHYHRHLEGSVEKIQLHGSYCTSQRQQGLSFGFLSSADIAVEFCTSISNISFLFLSRLGMI